MQALKLFGFVFAILASVVVARSQSLAISTSNTPPYANDQETGFQDLLAREAFRRIGIQVGFHHVQTERAILNVSKGIDDGNLIRVDGLSQIYPNIVKVPEKLFDYEFVVFARDGLFEPKSWDSLRPFRVGIIRGWKILERNITDTKSITRVRDENRLFDLLKTGYVDVVVLERWRGQHILKTTDLQGFQGLEPPLVTKPMYLYLHKRHQALVPQLTDALKAMKHDGTYQDLFEQALQPYMTR